MSSIQRFEFDWIGKYELGSRRGPRIVLFFSMNSEKHSMSHNKHRRGRHASSRARRHQPLYFGGAGYEAITLRVSWVGRGRRKMPSAEQRLRCRYRSLERVLLGLSLGSRAVWDIRSGCHLSCSVVVCHALRMSTGTSACTSTYHQTGIPSVMLMRKVGHRLQQWGERQISTYSTPAAAAAAAPAPAAPGGPAVTTVDSGSDDDDDSGPEAFSDTTGQ